MGSLRSEEAVKTLVNNLLYRGPLWAASHLDFCPYPICPPFLRPASEITDTTALPSEPAGFLLALCFGGLPSPGGKQTQKRVNTIHDEEVSLALGETQETGATNCLGQPEKAFLEKMTFKLVLEKSKNFVRWMREKGFYYDYF